MGVYYNFFQNNMMTSFFTSLKKHAVGMTLIFFLVACTITALALFRTPVFEAEARINVPVRKGVKGITSSSASPSKVPVKEGVSLFGTALEILRGNVLAEKVMTDIGITKVFPDLELESRDEEELLSHVLLAFQERLNITPVQGTQVIRIAFQHPDAAMSAKVVKTLLRLFQDQYKQVQPVERGVPGEDLLASQQEMQQAENALAMFLKNNGLLVVGKNKHEIIGQYQKKKQMLSEVQENMHKQAGRLHALKEQSTRFFNFDTKENEQNQKQFQEYQDDILSLMLYEQGLREKYGQGSTGDRLIHNVHLQIASLEKLLYAEAGLSEAEQKQVTDTAEQIVLARIAHGKQQEKADDLQRRVSQLEDTLQRITEQAGVV
ncbi:MAG: hypothetical protein D3909_17735, partial [Candidatus Electrothrix sp. ATG1]|nr:hypothetical protein [Candidatus Electrothrix sp. ATG1]